jgi:hypothetical protein
LPAAPGNDRGTRPSKPTRSTGCTFPRSTSQPPPRTWISTEATPATLLTASRAAAASAPGGSSTSICGVRPRTSERKALWNPEIMASDRMSAVTPRASPPAATAERKLAKASRRVLRR